MGIFGWSYPPGCNGTPYDENHPCDVCGNIEDDCICPECPVCGDFGNSACYIEHGMKRSDEQKFSLVVNERQWEQEHQAILQYENVYDEIADLYEE